LCFSPTTEVIIRNLACAESATQPTDQAKITELAETRLRSDPYRALKNVSCDWRDGVLVLRGPLPRYYLKQVAQEAVASLEGVERIDNQVEVVTPAFQPREG
jgi:osmotically-inducible protein OsmY